TNVGKTGRIFTSLLGRGTAATPGFLKAREYEFFRDAVASGAQPLTWNPVRMQLARIAQIREYLSELDTHDRFRTMGFAKFVKHGNDAPVGWKPYEGPLWNTARLDPETGALMTHGKYWGPPEAVKLWENAHNKGLIADPTWKGNAFRAIRTINATA